MPATRLADAPVHPHVSALSDTPTSPFDEVAAGFEDLTALALWSPRFPSPDRLREAAQGFVARPAWAGEEGPRPRVILAAGSFAVSAPDLARRERTRERAERGRQNTVDQVAGYLARGEDVPEREPCREITQWSRKSRANMTRALSELDYRPLLADPTRVPAMVTLTYPGDWLTVAPDGASAKRHLQAFRKRYARAWGHDLLCVWKMEFQGRGAPHFHLLTVPPHGTARIPGKRARADAWVGAGKVFRAWLSEVWTDIVAHPDPEERAKHLRAGTGVDFGKALQNYDPKRVAVYFSKHGSFSAKEYQHIVPEEWQEPGKGPGRFWGYWGLHRIAIAVELEPEEAVNAARVARRWADSKGTTREAIVLRTKGGAIRSEMAEVVGLAGAQTVESRRARRRRVRRPVRRLRNGRGFVAVNDGQHFAESIARGLEIWRTPVEQEPLAVRLARYKATKTAVLHVPEVADLVSEPEQAEQLHDAEPASATCGRCGEPLAAAVAHLGEHFGCDPKVVRKWGKGWQKILAARPEWTRSKSVDQ